MLTFTLDSLVQRADEQVSCDLAGETAILQLNSGSYFGLDPVGSFVWNQIANPTTVRVVRDAIIEEYDVTSARCEADLLELLAHLAQHGLIKSSPPHNTFSTKN